MITIHHLGVSQSERIVWLMEELELPYRLKWYRRKQDRLAPDEYLALHPAATAPVIEDGDSVLAESGAILEYICHRYASGKLKEPAAADAPQAAGRRAGASGRTAITSEELECSSTCLVQSSMRPEAALRGVERFWQ